MHHNMLMLLTASVFIFTSVRLEQAHAQDSAVQASAEKHIFTKDMTIYVSDFDLDAANVKVDSGGALGEARPKIIESPRKREEKDPQAQAKKLADLMSKSIVDDLRKAGYKAKRLAAGESRPSVGAWVHGVFTEVDEGNRRQRAVIGFGAGQSTMDLYVTLTDLSQPEKPLYTEGKHDDSGEKVGAVVTMNPYVAAAKFVMEKNAPEKTVKKTASEISADVVKHLKEYGKATSLSTSWILLISKEFAPDSIFGRDSRAGASIRVGTLVSLNGQRTTLSSRNDWKNSMRIWRR